MEEDDEQFEVRDLRPKGWFWTDDEFLNGYARLLGTTFSMIYLDLCRHADKNQRAHPSQSTIAKELSLNISSVNEGIKVLEYFGLIRKIRIGKTCTNRYDLLGKKHWRRDFSELLSITERLEKLDKKNKNDVEQFKNTLSSDLAQFKITTLTVLNHYVNSSKSNSKETHSKVTHSKVTQKKGINSDLEIAPQELDNSNKKKKDTDLEETQSTPNKDITKQDFTGKDINDLIELFKKVNPTYMKLFNNTTQRDALETLVKQFGVEKVKKMIEFLPEIFGKPYAPRITTPYQLMMKFGDLIAYLKSEQNKKPKIGKVK